MENWKVALGVEKLQENEEHASPATSFWTNFCSFPGFDDAFRAIERLSMYVFDLPVDVAVKQFKDMNEAF